MTTYDKISYPKIEESIKFILDDDIRINLESSSSESLANIVEVREYNLTIRYYTKVDMTREQDNEFVKNRVDKLKKALIDDQVNSTSNKWAKLEVTEITYNVEDDDNEDSDNIFIAELDVVATNYNQF